MEKITVKNVAAAVLALLLGGGGITGIYQKLSAVEERVMSMDKRMSNLCIVLVTQNPKAAGLVDCK